DANPLDPKLGSLANNGGLTQTMLPLAGSPAINNGSNALVPGGVTTDQRGQTRVQNGTVDIGAVEVTSSTFSTPKVTLQPVSQSFTTMLNGAVMVSFSAAASGSPYPQIQWQSSTNGTTYTNLPYLEANQSVYTFQALPSQDGELIRAVFTNSQGSVTTTSAKLTIYTMPDVQISSFPSNVAVGAVASMSAIAHGNP